MNDELNGVPPNLNFFFNEEEDEENNRVIFTNGIFDLLHLGHIRFLQACKAIGGHLVVGINSDTSTRRLKGEHRPFVSEAHRKHMLLALDCVDEVVVFVEDNPVEILKMLQPEIYVKSDEYLDKPLIEFTTVQKYGGSIMIVQPSEDLRNVHTSGIVDKIFKSEMKRRTS